MIGKPEREELTYRRSVREIHRLKTDYHVQAAGYDQRRHGFNNISDHFEMRD